MATATARKTTRQRGASRASVKQSTVYEWVALDKRGHKMKGEMAGKNAALVKAELRSQGMNPQSVKEKVQAVVRVVRQARDAKGHRHLQSSDCHHDGLRRTHDAGLRDHRRGTEERTLQEHAGGCQAGHRRRLLIARVHGALPGAVRRVVPQPGEGRRVGGCAGYRAGHGGHLQGTHGSDEGQDQEGPVLPDHGAGGGGTGDGDHAAVRGAGVQGRVRECRGTAARPDTDGGGGIGVHAELLVDHSAWAWRAPSSASSWPRNARPDLPIFWIASR